MGNNITKVVFCLEALIGLLILRFVPCKCPLLTCVDIYAVYVILLFEVYLGEA